MTTLTPPRTEPQSPKTLRRKVVESNNQLFRASPLNYIVLVITFGLSVFPLYWMLVMASRTNDQIVQVPPVLVPGSHLAEHVRTLFDTPDVMFAKALVNSFIVASTITVGVVVFSALAGFAFARLRFRGNNVLLAVVVLTMMVPVQLGTVPLYMMMSWFGIQGTLPTVILPYLASGFGVFLMRQYTTQAIPEELIEAARVDGAGLLRTFGRIILPISMPGFVVTIIWQFTSAWNDYLFAIFLSNTRNGPITIALNALAGAQSPDYAASMAGALITSLPTLIVYVLLGRWFIGGLMAGSVKS